MWIFSSQGFISIVHSDKPDILIVRSRFRGHIERIFPKAKVIEDANRDYLYRTELPIREVLKMIARLVSKIHYPNFKDSLSDENYLDCCLDVYSVVLKHSGNWDL